MRTRFRNTALKIDTASPFHYQLECMPVSATFYIGGDRCTRANLQYLAQLARTLPKGVRTLRIDEYAVEMLNVDTLLELHRFLGEWRALRGGEVHVAAPATKVRDEEVVSFHNTAMTHDDRSVWHCGECGYSAWPKRGFIRLA